MKLKIKVTKEIIEKAVWCGVEGHDDVGDASTNCAVALAVRDIFPAARVYTPLWSPCVHILPFNDINIKEGIKIPYEAVVFIGRFDRLSDHPEARLYMDPIEFEVEVPESVINKIGIKEAERIIFESKTLEIIK